MTKQENYTDNYTSAILDRLTESQIMSVNSYALAVAITRAKDASLTVDEFFEWMRSKETLREFVAARPYIRERRGWRKWAARLRRLFRTP